MKFVSSIIFVFLFSCSSPRPDGFYRITDYNEAGEVEGVYSTKSIDINEEGVKFKYNGVETFVSGSYKVERE